MGTPAPLDTFTIGGICYPIVTLEQARSVGAMVVEWKRKHAEASDPRIARDRRRAEIDAVIREDARRFPAFATARMAAVMAACEMWGDDPQVLGSVRAMLINGGWLHSYETRRGGRTKPSEDADHYARHTFGTEAQGHYERARGMR